MPTDNNASKDMGSLIRFAWLGCGAIFIMPVAMPAQGTNPTADEMVRCFAVTYTVGRDPNDCKDVVPGAIGVLMHPDIYGDYVNDVMDGLEQLALDDPEFRVRTAAAVYLMAPGNRELVAENPKGVVDRVGSLYRKSKEPAVRSVLIRWMPYQAEQEDALTFLETIATASRSSPDQMWPDEVLAIDALARMGGRGRETLRRLSDTGSVHNDLARQRLEFLKQRDYRLEAQKKGAQP